ncbi:MAG TPA: hypothetical protein VF678_01655 [bacterium]
MRSVHAPGTAVCHDPDAHCLAVMTEETQPERDGLDPLSASLDDLHQFVIEHPEQTLHRMAENAVLHWTRVVEGKDHVQPRLNTGGYVPQGFHFGMEANPANQLDPVHPPLTVERYGEERAARMLALRHRLDQFFEHSGYRSSSDQCDQVMVEVARFSRYLSAHCAHVERTSLAERLPGEDPPRMDLYQSIGVETLLFQVRFHYMALEPYLNDAVVAWQQNHLEEYERALQTLNEQLRATVTAMPHPPGFPVRALGRARQRISSFHPEQRPQRGKSMFSLRFNQLIKRMIAEGGLPLRTALQLDTEVRQFLTMAKRNHYLVSADPTFQQLGRAALNLIRNRPTSHVVLTDPMDFFKKAVMFANGTYTVAGGGIDPLYLQLRQLERYFKFEMWANGRPFRQPLERCLLHWEENRWDGFKVALLELAERVRATVGGPAPLPPSQR